MSEEKFDIRQVLNAFKAVNTKAGENNDGIETVPFLNAYTELAKVFDYLGSAFKFVTTDVMEKINILREHHALNPSVNATLQSMVLNEVKLGTTSTDTKTESGVTLKSASRTLLRLLRALDFILTFFKAITVAPENAYCSTLASEAYGKTLSHHHGWAIRTAVKVALYTLPTLTELIKRFNTTFENGIKTISEIIDTVQPMYTTLDALYTEKSLQALP